MRSKATTGKSPLRFSLAYAAWLPALAMLLLPLTAIAAPPAVGETAKIAVFPTVPYYIYIVYQSLALFWIAILGLLVIIRMKIKEIERVQSLGADQEDPAAPLLQ